jgi:ABC-type nickel/cobalt efflux system permease component RcnA
MKTLRAFVPLLFTAVLFAHPMGNLSVNHYIKLEPGAKGVDATYVLDLAELPTFELTQNWTGPRDTAAAAQARQWIANLSFTENGKKLTPKILGTQLSVIDGAGNLPVYRIATKLHIPASGGRFEYADNNYPTRAGWREVVIAPGEGSDVTKASNGSTDVSQGLTSYPQDPTKAPPQDMHAWFEWKPLAAPVTQVRKPVVVAAPAATPAPAPVQEAPRDVRPPEAPSMGTVTRNDTISKLLRTKDISIGLMALLIGLSFWFGALHALEPGHGKTMVAAYLVGAKGTTKHALLLGGMVTFTHTFSVFLLGLATMFLSKYVMADKLSKWLGIVSGLSIVWIGALMLWKRAKKLQHEVAHSHDHPHTHPHPHPHHQHEHAHDGSVHSHVPEGDISLGGLIALGASGGLVPCPSALILLLSAISIGRIGLGLILLVSFSLGLAIVLTVTGMLVLYAKNLLPEGRGTNHPVFRYMPVVSAVAILAIGVLMTSVSLGWIPAGRFIG